MGLLNWFDNETETYFESGDRVIWHKTDWDGAFVCPICYGNLEKSENKIIEVL